MRHLIAPALALALAQALAAGDAPAPDPGRVCSEDEAWALGWPNLTGPFGNLTSARTGARLVDDLAQTRLVWDSEDSDLGRPKYAVSGWGGSMADALGPGSPAHAGSCSSPIVGGGRVFAASFRPSGPVFEVARLKGGGTAKICLAADDLLIAYDARTGKTAWKAVEAERGLARPQIKREGFGPSPAYADGRVFSLGTTGRLYAYEAATGRKLWEGDIGAAHQSMEAKKAALLARPDGGLGLRLPWLSSLTVAGGTLIVPLFDASPDMGLRGVDPATGARRWELPKAISAWATPNVWRHGGREYLLMATVGGHLRLADPADGRVLWTVDGLGATHYTLSPSADTVLVNVGTGKTRTADDRRGQFYGRSGAYRLSPAGAERAWTAPDSDGLLYATWFDVAAMRKYIARDGRFWHWSHSSLSGTHENRAFALDERSGELLVDSGPGTWQGQYMAVEDRILHFPDAAHSDRLTMELLTAEPRDFRRLSGPWKPPHTGATGYEVFIECPVIAGRIFMRTEEGRLRCYDLRAP